MFEFKLTCVGSYFYIPQYGKMVAMDEKQLWQGHDESCVVALGLGFRMHGSGGLQAGNSAWGHVVLGASWVWFTALSEYDDGFRAKRALLLGINLGMM